MKLGLRFLGRHDARVPARRPDQIDVDVVDARIGTGQDGVGQKRDSLAFLDVLLDRPAFREPLTDDAFAVFAVRQNDCHRLIVAASPGLGGGGTVRPAN